MKAAVNGAFYPSWRFRTVVFATLKMDRVLPCLEPLIRTNKSMQCDIGFLSLSRLFARRLLFDYQHCRVQPLADDECLVYNTSRCYRRT